MADPAASTPTKKRRRAGDGGDGDEEATPRAPSLRAPTDFAEISSSSSDISEASGTSSPTKQLHVMSLHDDGFVLAKLPPSGPPATPGTGPERLGRLIENLRMCAHNIHVIPNHLQETLRSSGTINEFLFPIVFSDSPHLPQLSLETASDIVTRASRCEVRHEEEASWNAAVHYPLLHAACSARASDSSGMVDFMTCTTARISSRFRPRNASAKMVDFSMFIDPTLDPDDNVAERIDQVCVGRPELSINHTSYLPLSRLPISVSIETKKSSDNWDKAQLQMGTWQSAQLRSLANAPAIDFLPGIIIMGHAWHFVVTVRGSPGKKPSLYSHIPIGSTTSVLGVYQIVAGISALRRWSEEEFWPLFKEEVLGLRQA